jgi:hypothetical protein
MTDIMPYGTDNVLGYDHWHSDPTQFDHVLPFNPCHHRPDQHRRKSTLDAIWFLD